MGQGFIHSLVVVVAAVATCGCESLFKPSDQTRQAAFTQGAKLFTADRTVALHQTYFVFSGTAQLPPLKFDTNIDRLVINSPKNTEAHQGLASGLASDGYLLTAGHVLGATNYVFGWFEGRVDVRPARVVFKSPTRHRDLAVIKVAGKLDACVRLGDRPKAGDPAFAVGRYHLTTEMGGHLGIMAGTIREVTQDPTNAFVDRIEMDLPLWHSDSGGPLLSAAGRLIGVVTGYEYEYFHQKLHGLCFFPDQQFLEDIIARDRQTSDRHISSPGS